MDPLDSSSFDRDVQFQRLLRHDANVDLTEAALEVARDFHNDIDFEGVDAWLDQQAQTLRPQILRTADADEGLQAFCVFMTETLGFRGSAMATCTAEGSFLDSVIANRFGLPISLSILYIALAEKVGISLQGVSSPQHFLCRCDDSPAGPIFVDPFHAGRTMTQIECVSWLKELTGLSVARIKPTLRVASARTIIERMLNNLRNLFLCRKDWRGLRTVQHRLVLLNPCSYAARRDLAYATMKSGRPGAAIDMLEECLTNAPEGERSTVNLMIDEAHRMVARWN
ncbi:hypothetical protein VT03_23555 [Planctomyces sp. SH-PL14]|nr:hypothetical protein VT03_23555 [Planctomyces sp. SH-PL14]